MFKFIKNLFSSKLTAVDELIRFFGTDYLYICNCINLLSEYCLPSGEADVEGWKDPNKQYLKIGFGRYKGEEETCSVIEVWIDRHLNIVKVVKNPPYFKGHSRRYLKRIEKLYSRIQNEKQFLTGNMKLRDWIGALFKATPRSLYAYELYYSGITTHGYGLLDHVIEELDTIERDLVEQDRADAERYEAELASTEEEAKKEESKSQPRIATASEEDIETILGIEHKKEKKRKHK